MSLRVASGLYRQTDSMLYRDMVAPGYNFQVDAMESASDSDFDDSDESLELLTDFDNIDVNGFLGRAIAVWSYNNLDSLLIFTPLPNDTLWHVTQYVESKFPFNRSTEKIMIMEPGERTPRETKDIYELRQGSVVMVMPKKNINLTVEINQLKLTFPISADLMCTVYEVKSYIKQVKGISIDQQDILFKDKVLENCRRLYEYRVKNAATMHVLIQVHFDLLINVETFWGKTYRLYIDRCSTGSDIIYRVFGRTFSRHGTKQVTVHELYVPIHVLVFQHNRKSLHWDYCLGFYGIKNADTLVLNTVGRHNDMNMQTLLVITELGENFEVMVSQFDRWSVVAFMVHGYSDVPVDLIRLYKKEVQMDLTKVIGSQAKNTVIMMNITMTNIDKDMLFGIPVKVSVGHNVIENLKILPSKRVKDVKDRLEDVGVPNASMYELCTNNFKLPDHALLQHVIKDFEKVLHLKVERYPVFLHAPDGVIYKTMVDVNQDMKQLHYKIEMKSGHAISSCRLIMCGQQLRLSDNAILYENGITIRNSIFIETASMFDTFFITSGRNLIKMRVPETPTSDMIKRSVWTARNIPEGSITCLQTFLFWFYSPRVNRKFALPRRRKKRIHLPAANEPLHLYSDRPEKKELVRVYNKTGQDNKKHKSDMYVPSLTKEATMEEETETQRTWPISLQRPVRPKRDVEDWINTTVYEPKINRQHIRTPTRKKPARQDRNPEPQKTKGRIPHISHHMVPRWINELHKTDTQGILATDRDGTVYRTIPKQMPYDNMLQNNKSQDKKKKKKVHNQGDATTAKYMRTKRYFDRQELVFPENGDSDEENVYDRPHIVLH
ncbi:uncharacterized protein LOC128231360 isoform X1 [Mya arenaria]|nr:uncharacterized protein LOC128231360 isoform X1 [Mya arenaria]